jgi:hypothetical protein
MYRFQFALYSLDEKIIKHSSNNDVIINYNDQLSKNYEELSIAKYGDKDKAIKALNERFKSECHNFEDLFRTHIECLGVEDFDNAVLEYKKSIDYYLTHFLFIYHKKIKETEELFSDVANGFFMIDKDSVDFVISQLKKGFEKGALIEGDKANKMKDLFEDYDKLENKDNLVLFLIAEGFYRDIPLLQKEEEDFDYRKILTSPEFVNFVNDIEEEDMDIYNADKSVDSIIDDFLRQDFECFDYLYNYAKNKKTENIITKEMIKNYKEEK